MTILFAESLITDNDNPMSTLYNRKCSKIKEKYDFFDISSTSNNINLDNYETLLLGCRSLYIYKFYRSNTKYKQILKQNLEKLMVIKNKFILLQDIHNKTYGSLNDLANILNTYNINVILTFNNCYESKILKNKTTNCKYYHLPHFIDTNIFNTTKNHEKEYDIVLYGAIHPVHYPFRKRLFELITHNKETFNNKVLIIDKPNVFDPKYCENGLAEILNKTKISIATKSKYNYLVAKYLEIPACNCLVAGDIPSDADKIMQNNIIQLKETMTDAEIIEILKYTINNYDNYKNKITDYQQYIINNYNLDKYITKLEQIIKNMN